jgi:hypothetical protein
MPDVKPFLSLHQSQIKDIAASIDIGPVLAARQASPQARQFALQACENAGVDIPAAGAFTIAEASEAAAKAFSDIGKRIEFKATLSAGGLLLEPSPASINKLAVVTAGLMLRKANIPAPKDGRPYSVREFEDLLAGKDISITHRMEIKNACFQAGIIDAASGVVAKPVAAPPIQAAKSICESLRLDWPEGGKKLMASRIDDAMDKYHWVKFEDGKEVRDHDRRVRAKNTLSAAGVLA